ncbi:MAG: biotin/lipoate A/B protein ligase family protein [Cyanobacteria bacterium P01_D01_bin.105]
MAIDSWLLDQYAKGLQPSILRFYTWIEPTISLGYHQRQWPSHWNHLMWQGRPVSVVRRPTGGRAVLHQGDLTYAVITAAANGKPRRETYRQLCQFLIEGWQSLGVSLAFGNAGRGYIKNPNCFGTATAADLVMDDGYKLIGSAQVYRNGCVLQHGSIRLKTDSLLYEKVFLERIVPPQLPETLRNAGGTQIVIQALTEAAEQSFDASFRPATLSVEELESAQAQASL